MILGINTIGPNEIEVKIKDKDVVFSSGKISASRAQAELLLPLIEKMIQKHKFKLKDIEKIEVENFGGSFTSLRIGVATANALGFALGIPVKGSTGENVEVEGLSVVPAIYDREPDIGISTKGMD